VTLQYSGREIALQRREAEATIGIPLQRELDQSVTQSTNSVIENDGIGPARFGDGWINEARVGGIGCHE
jgi:hypothetical protein